MVSAEVLHERASKIELIAFDVDGVMTDGRLIFSGSGEEYKAFDVRDGQGLVMTQKAGLELAVITGRNSTIVTRRMAELGISRVYQGQSDKVSALEDLIKQTGVAPSAIAYCGDDLPDLSVFRCVGLSFTVADAPQVMIDTADWCTKACGGRGAVREICELILDAKGRLTEVIESYTTSPVEE